MIDPGGITNWSVKHFDWSERKWHPKSCRDQDDTDELLKNIRVKSRCNLAYGMVSDNHISYLQGNSTQKTYDGPQILTEFFGWIDSFS